MSAELMRRIVIVGATSAIAVEAARHLVAKGSRDFVLIGRDEERLQAVATDLRVRSADSTAAVLVVSMTDAAAIAETAAGLGLAGHIDGVLIAHGSLIAQQHAQEDPTLAERSLIVNAVSPAIFAEAFATVLEKQGSGTLAVIGSVAGDRGRKSNYVYGAAKGLLERYLQGLRHRLAPTAVKVLLIKPGPTDTPMTAELKEKGRRLAKRERAGAAIARALGRRSGTIYVPGRWRPVMFVIRAIPFFVFKRMDL